MILGWCTDIHLDSAKPPVLKMFVESAAGKYDAIVVTGDISNGLAVEKHLTMMADAVACPVYFVTGNHDAWGTSIGDLDARMSMLSRRHANRLVYLTEHSPIKLTETTALVGVSGWGDARWGAGEETNHMVNDFRRVKDLYDATKYGGLINKLRWIADRDATRLRGFLATAVKTFKHVIIATHVPPFPGASYYRGERSNHDALALYACRATADVIVDFAHACPDTKFLVLCGHTHGAADYRPFDNLRVLAGEAEYGEPVFQAPIDVE